MPLSFFRDSVTVLRAPSSLKNGMPFFDWENASQSIVSKVQVTAQATGRDFGERQMQASDRRTLRAEYNADIQAGDRIVWNGDTYEIEGEVFHTMSPTGRVSSTRCTLVRWTG